MSVYKVPQDVEAEDKFLGPLSFKQFLFFGGTAIFGWLTFMVFVKFWPLAIIFAIPTLVFAVFAVPWSKDQPTEVFLGARIRFFFKPRKRIWDQTGIKNLVKITVPKREVHIYSDGLSQSEVRKRFGALATVVDSRGWAIKNSRYSSSNNQTNSDRLVQAATAPPTESQLILDETPDVLDEDVSNLAKNFDSMIKKSEQRHKSETQRLIQEARESSFVNKNATSNSPQTKAQSRAPAAPAAAITKSPSSNPNKQPKAQDFWFINQQQSEVPQDPNLVTFKDNSVVAPGSKPIKAADNPHIEDETAVLDLIHKKEQRDALQTGNHHGKVIQPTHLENPNPAETKQDPVQEAEPRDKKTTTENVTTAVNPDIINLANNKDLNISTIQRQVNKKPDHDDQDEVVVSLH